MQAAMISSIHFPVKRNLQEEISQEFSWKETICSLENQGSRTMGFNHVQIDQYFNNLESTVAKYDFCFSVDRIYNVDEIGTQTVPNKLPKRIAPTGKREGASEQGKMVSVACAMRAVGDYITPFFIFDRYS